MTLETGQNVLLNVEEEPRLDLELVQTLLLQTEELTVSGLAARLENVTLRHAQVRNSEIMNQIWIINPSDGC